MIYALNISWYDNCKIPCMEYKYLIVINCNCEIFQPHNRIMSSKWDPLYYITENITNYTSSNFYFYHNLVIIDGLYLIVKY